MSSRSLPWWSSSSPGWREWSLLTAWTAIKITVNVNNQDVHNNNDLQDVSLGLLGLCYLTTGPDPGEAVAMMRLATATSVLDTVTRSVGANVTRSQDITMVRNICSIVRTVLVFSMGVRVINTMFKGANILY